MRLIITLIILVFIPSVYSFNQNVTLNDYPEFFFKGSGPDVYFDAKFITSSTKDLWENTAVNYLINRIQKDYEFEFEAAHPKEGHTVIVKAGVPDKHFKDIILNDIEVIDINKINAIVIGTPCNNKIIRETLTIQESQCDNYFKTEEGIIKIIVSNYRVIFLISGDSGQTIFELAKYFHERMMNPASKVKMNLKGINELKLNLEQIGVKTVEIKSSKEEYKNKEARKQFVESQKQLKEIKSKKDEIIIAIKNIRKSISLGIVV